MPRGVSWLHVTGDVCFIALAFFAAHGIRFASGWIPAPLGHIPLSQWLALLVASLPMWLMVAALHGLYYTRLKQSLAVELVAVANTCAQGLVATILLTFTLRGLPDSRLTLLLTFALAWFWLSGYRWLVRRLARRRPLAVVIGDSPLAAYLRRKFSAGGGRFALALACAEPDEFDPAAVDAVFCDTHLAGQIWRYLPERPARVAVYLLPEGEAAATAGLGVATVAGVPTMALKTAADLAMMRRIKRVVDISGALVLLVLTSPLWLLCWAGIKLTMPGPVFFSHGRKGLFGREFRLLKFRSMVADAHKLPVDLAGFDEKYKLKNDPRITPFGRFLRKSSLDELPQLINILRGELSLVGPRPIVADEVARYGVWGQLLLTVPPGLTGLWQVSGRSDTSYQERVDFDLYYINNWSLGLDLLLLFRTIPAVLSRKGAY